jgi:hypothetical protein
MLLSPASFGANSDPAGCARLARDAPKAHHVTGEDWIIERTSSGALKFVLYMNPFHQLLPDSAPLQLE